MAAMKTAPLSTLLLAAGLLAPAAQAQQTVYKCRAANGQVVFQQGPCTADLAANKVDATPANVVEGNPVGDMTLRRDFQMRRAAENGVVLPGMTTSEMYTAWGYPTRRNITETAHGQSVQYVFRTRHGTHYAYTDNGRVTAVQHSLRR
jgi:hypothetical protein